MEIIRHFQYIEFKMNSVSMDTYLLNTKTITNPINLEGVGGIHWIRNGSIETDEIILETEDIWDENALKLLSIFIGDGLLATTRVTSGGSYLKSPLSSTAILQNIDTSNFDEKNRKLIDEILKKIKKMLDSNNIRRKKEGIKRQSCISIYYRALLLRRQFLEESYLNFWRILEIFNTESTALGFSDFINKKLSKSFKLKQYKGMQNIELYKSEQIPKACVLFRKIVKKLKNKTVFQEPFYQKTENQIFFITLYSLYQFRNKYLHNGYPFPDVRCLTDQTTYFVHGGDESLHIPDSYEDYERDKEKIIWYLDLFPWKKTDLYSRNDCKILYSLLPNRSFLQKMAHEILLTHLKK